MRKAALPFAALAVGALSLSVPSEAHHGWGNYDSTNPLAIEGQILAVDFDYPHATIELEDGDSHWHVVLAPPSRMERRGLPSGALSVGLDVTVVGYASLPNPGEMRAENITVNGRTVQLR